MLDFGVQDTKLFPALLTLQEDLGGSEVNFLFFTAGLWTEFPIVQNLTILKYLAEPGLYWEAKNILQSQITYRNQKK